MLSNMEFGFECFFYDSNVEIGEFRMFFYKDDTQMNKNLNILVRQTESKQSQSKRD